MRKFSKVFIILLLVTSLVFLGSCSKKNDKNDNPFGDGIEGPIVDL